MQLSINNRDKTIMSLRTDLFCHATKSLPAWNPSHDGWDWNPKRKCLRRLMILLKMFIATWLCMKTFKPMRTLFAIRNIDTWLARVFNKAGPYWKQLMEQALKTKQYYEYDGMLDYYRPSLWLLRELDAETRT